MRVVNGKMDTAGTTGGVDTYVTLVGTEGTTGKVSLLGTLRYFFKGMDAGTYEDVVIETERDLGDVQVVILGIDGVRLAFDSNWFVAFAEVTDLSKQSQTEQFPFYHWIKAGEYVSSVSNAGEPKQQAEDRKLVTLRWYSRFLHLRNSGLRRSDSS